MESSSFIDSEFLIIEVEKHPCLYDMRIPDYRNRDLKKYSWLSVTKALVGPKWDEMDELQKSKIGKEVQNRWKSMKDSYSKSIKSQEIKTGDAAKPRKQYVFYRKMSFLQSVTQPRETSGTMNTSQIATDNGSKISVSPCSDISQSERTESAVSTLMFRKKHSRLPIKRKPDAFKKEIISTLNTHNEVLKLIAKKHTSEVSDPDEMFLLSQIPFIKRLSNTDKLDFQIKFMQLLQSYSN